MSAVYVFADIGVLVALAAWFFFALWLFGRFEPSPYASPAKRAAWDAARWIVALLGLPAIVGLLFHSS